MAEFQTFILIGAAVFIGVLTFAVIYKLAEVSAARRWPATTGKILSSGIAARRKPSQPRGDSVANYPEVVYEYRVGGRRYRGERVSIGEAAGNFGVEETLARYPAGAAVQVYYNPANPAEAVLERELPPQFARGITYASLIFLGGAAILLFSVTNVPKLLAEVLPRPAHALFVTLAGGCGLFVLSFALVLHRQVAAARHWPATRGEIVAAGIASRREFSHGRWSTQHGAYLVYTYTVEGQRYTGDRLAFGGRISWSALGLAQRQIEQYSEGSEVQVFYDPHNPGEAVLERRAIGITWLWIVGIGLLALATLVGGL